MNTIDILKTHNAWRRGDDTRTQCELGFSATDIGRAIDDAVRAIAERDQLRAELDECVRAWALTKAELSQERGRVREPVARVKTVGGYPDESEHVAEWLCKHKDLKDGDYLYLAPTPEGE